MDDIKEDVAIWGFDFPMWDILAFCGENASLHRTGVIHISCNEREPWTLDDWRITAYSIASQLRK